MTGAHHVSGGVELPKIDASTQSSRSRHQNSTNAQEKRKKSCADDEGLNVGFLCHVRASDPGEDEA
jgi:hypothetical protein